MSFIDPPLNQFLAFCPINIDFAYESLKTATVLYNQNDFYYRYTLTKNIMNDYVHVVKSIICTKQPQKIYFA